MSNLKLTTFSDFEEQKQSKEFGTISRINIPYFSPTTSTCTINAMPSNSIVLPGKYSIKVENFRNPWKVEKLPGWYM